MKKIISTHTLNGNGKVFAISLDALFRAADGDGSEMAVTTEALDNLKVLLLKSGVTGVLSVPRGTSGEYFYTLNTAMDVMTVTVKNLPAGTNVLSLVCQTGTNAKSVRQFIMTVKDGAQGVDASEAVNIEGQDIIVKDWDGDISSLEERVSSLEYPDAELVNVQLYPASGSIDWSGKILTVSVEGEEDIPYDIQKDGSVTFDVPIGNSYTIHYPIIEGYAAPDDEDHVAGLSERHITRNYDTLGSVATSIVLEERSAPTWTRGGNLKEVDDILNADGSWVIDEVHGVRAKLSATNDLKFEDGEDWSGTYGNAFRHIIPCHFAMTRDALGKSVLHGSRRRISDKTFPELWIGKFKGHVADGKLWSQPNVEATGDMTIEAFFAAAQAQGVDYGIGSYLDWRYIVALHLLKFGTPAVETTYNADNMGVGLQNAGDTYYNFDTGATVSLGDGTGEVALTDGSAYKQNKLFGIEAPTGQQWELMQNIFAKDGQFYIYKGNQLSNTIDEAHPDFLRKVEQISGSGSYIGTMALGDDFDVLPKTTGGSSSSGWTDGFYATTSDTREVQFGGSSSRGSLAGLGSSASLDLWSSGYDYLGVRLCFRGDIKRYDIVSGARMAELNS